MLASRHAWVSIAKLEGREVLRVCEAQGETTIADVDELVVALENER
jgi:predicted RNA-binding protein associated with RNAse of E/G family